MELTILILAILGLAVSGAALLDAAQSRVRRLRATATDRRGTELA